MDNERAKLFHAMVSMVYESFLMVFEDISHL